MSVINEARPVSALRSWPISSGYADKNLDISSPTLTWKRDAQKALMAMQPKRAASIRDKCREIASAPPPAKHRNLIPLAGVPNGYRARFGDWRVSFTIGPDTDVMEVFEVAARGGAYRW